MSPEILAIVSFACGGIFLNLVSNQVEAVLPHLARWIVRRVAARMGARQEQCEGEWLADLSDVPGGLGKIVFALCTLAIPLRTRLEFWRDEPLVGLRAVAVWCGDRVGGILALIAMAVILRAFPLVPGRYMALTAMAMPLCLAGVASVAPLRRVVGGIYARCSYSTRVIV